MNKELKKFVSDVIKQSPSDWLKLTTHRLDIYNESQAKSEFLTLFEKMWNNKSVTEEALAELPTAYDYIRLGHPLSSILEWAVALNHDLPASHVISFSSKITPILAILRKNLMDGKETNIYFEEGLPDYFDQARIKSVYGYHFNAYHSDQIGNSKTFKGSTVFVKSGDFLDQNSNGTDCDFTLYAHHQYGSVLIINHSDDDSYISEIQHVRRRETIAMTPSNCMAALLQYIGKLPEDATGDYESNKLLVQDTIKNITQSETPAIIASSGLSIQYAIVMGLIDSCLEHYKDKPIKIVVPPNCYGGTNDQARRVVACLPQVEIMDLPVDGDNDMVRSTEQVLSKIAEMDAVALIIAEIPTNPRVEVPEMDLLRDALAKKRFTSNGEEAIPPVFILDQTFCPNVHFLGDNETLSSVQTISYVSGSKFPSGGLCTAGYCVANKKAAHLMDKIETHLALCDNRATNFQMSALAAQMPSMLDRIQSAYENTRSFVNYIQEILPEAKINFVSEDLASQTFTPSVFSLDLPTKGNNEEERESYKRELNLKLINMMITQIPHESKYCVSYGQLKGCYWTIPATSTQGTTKEGDKDYIVRVALSGDMDLEKHKAVFAEFVSGL